MKLPKIKKNGFSKYIYEKDLHLAVLGFNRRFDWLAILVISFIVLLILLYSSLSLFSNVNSQIEDDDFIPKPKTVNEVQLKRVIDEIDSKKPAVIPIESLEIIDEEA